MKDSIRKTNILKRNKLSKDYIKSAGEGIAESFINSGLLDKKSFMGYFPVNNEAPILPLLKLLFIENKSISLPVINKNNLIIPVNLSDFGNLKKGKYNIPEPSEGIRVSPLEIEVVFVPGVAFDSQGERMGYGKGYYDRFLTESNFIKIGVCYEFQICDKPLPVENHDIDMDYILTEKSLYEVKHVI